MYREKFDSDPTSQGRRLAIDACSSVSCGCFHFGELSAMNRGVENIETMAAIERRAAHRSRGRRGRRQFVVDTTRVPGETV
jgi:hypothetical protein